MATNCETAKFGAIAEGEVRTYRRDDLTLAVRVWKGDGASPKRPIVCLPGLTRNSRDFSAFASQIRRLDPSRTVIAFDYRGRGLSDPVSDPSAYNAAEEAKDVLAGLDHLGIAEADLIGTSRGVIVIHLIAVFAPERIGRVVFNDAGPRIEAAGLAEIRDYLEAARPHETLDKASDAVERLFAPTFPSLGRPDFEREARALHVERNGSLVSDFDPKLLRTLDAVEADKPLPEMWDLFERLADREILVLRGEHSNILTPETVTEMERRHPGLKSQVVKGQGHAPFLETAGLPGLILSFLDENAPA
ncbi:alpha/beta fold hydrolase [Fulvimarina endophytica]|nr:alpha/beta hydrolase [Fulvimarina endophytica]